MAAIHIIALLVAIFYGLKFILSVADELRATKHPFYLVMPYFINGKALLICACAMVVWWFA